MTTTPDTSTRIDAIRAREQAATPGPWGVYVYGGDSLIEIAADLEDTGCGYSARRTVCRFDEDPLDNDPTHREWTAEEDWTQVQADAAFTANAREDVKLLLDRVAELEKLVKQLADPEACWFDHHGHCQAHGWPHAEPSCPDGRANKMFPPVESGT